MNEHLRHIESNLFVFNLKQFNCPLDLPCCIAWHHCTEHVQSRPNEKCCKGGSMCGAESPIFVFLKGFIVHIPWEADQLIKIHNQQSNCIQTNYWPFDPPKCCGFGPRLLIQIICRFHVLACQHPRLQWEKIEVIRGSYWQLEITKF